MYYIEKWINGKLYWKGTPKGEWIEFTIGQYKEKIQVLESQVKKLNTSLVSESVFENNDSYQPIIKTRCTHCGAFKYHTKTVL